MLEMKVWKLIDSFQDDQSFLAVGLQEADSSFQKKFNRMLLFVQGISCHIT